MSLSTAVAEDLWLHTNSVITNTKPEHLCVISNIYLDVIGIRVTERI
jgi:hypothetical protein